MQEMWVRSLDWEDPLEEGIATHSSILALDIPWTEEPGGLQSLGLHSSSISHHNLLPHIPQTVSPQSIAALTLGLLHNP